MGPHWGDEGGLVLKDLPQPSTPPRLLMPVCPVLSGPLVSAHPTLHCTRQPGRAGGEAISMAASPETPNLSCPQLAKLIVPFSTLPALTDSFQTPLCCLMHVDQGLHVPVSVNK